MAQKIDRAQRSRARIIAVAGRLFAEQGYEATSIEAVLKACGISRGALYHHFASKDAVLIAVVEAIEEDVLKALMAAGHGADDGIAALQAGSGAWLRLANDPVIRQIVLIDAPAALGWTAWRGIESRYSLGVLKAGLSRVADEGRLPAHRVDMYAHIMLAVLTELAMLIARSDDPASAIADGEAFVARLLDAMLDAKPI